MIPIGRRGIFWTLDVRAGKGRASLLAGSVPRERPAMGISAARDGGCGERCIDAELAVDRDAKGTWGCMVGCVCDVGGCSERCIVAEPAADRDAKGTCGFIVGCACVEGGGKCDFR